jgi:transcriptional regulator with XRE-family HTH domain
MLGEELRAVREARGLTVRDCAEKSGISHPALVAIENGDRYPSLRTLEALAHCLNVNFVIGPDETVIEPLT